MDVAAVKRQIQEEQKKRLGQRLAELQMQLQPQSRQPQKRTKSPAVAVPAAVKQGVQHRAPVVSTAANAKWITVRITPIKPKPHGCAVGFLGRVGDEDYMFKLGMIKTEERNVTSSILSKSIAVRAIERDAIREVVGAAVFEFLSELSGGQFIVPVMRLANVPVVNWFTQHNLLAVSYYKHINSKRPSSEHLNQAVHIASKMIAGYEDLSKLVAVDGSETISTPHFVAKYHRPPTHAMVEGRVVRVHGIVHILAAAKLVADTDCLGGGLNNAGFVVLRNPFGVPQSVRAVKIDTGFSFNFHGPENIYTRSFTPFPLCHQMKDRRDIQFGNNQIFQIEFGRLLPAQKEAFMKTFKHGLRRLDRKTIAALIWQDNAFNFNKIRVKQKQVAQAADEWLSYLSQLAKTYDE